MDGDNAFNLPDPSEIASGSSSTEGAMFRSVAIAPPAPAMLFSVPTIPGTQLLGLQKLETSDKPKDAEDSTEDAGPKFIPSADSSSSAWTWQIAKLRRVPMYHPVERGALRLEDIPLDTVSSRISDFFWQNSITCSYSDAEPGRADCLTQSLLKFTVQLWQGKCKTQVIMEVQRRQGCSIEMQRLKGRIYRAVESGPEEMDTSDTSGRSAANLIQNVVGSVPADAAHGERDPLDITVELLESNCLDQNRLGMESLQVLTDPTKVTMLDADRISHILIAGDGHGDTRLREKFKTYFVGIEKRDSEAAGEYDSDDDTDQSGRYAKGEFFGGNHMFALHSLSNALESCARCQRPLRMDANQEFWVAVVNALIYNLKVAAGRPLEAALSAKCIRLVQSMEPGAMTSFKTELLPHLESAYHYGRSHNLWLQQESEQLIGRLEYAH